MSSGLPRVLVGFHDVELWTVVTAYLVGVAVVVPVGIPQITVLILAWHAHQVQGSNTSTVASC